MIKKNKKIEVEDLQGEGVIQLGEVLALHLVQGEPDLARAVFFFKQKTAYEVSVSDWSSDVCSSDLSGVGARRPPCPGGRRASGETVPPRPWSELAAHGVASLGVSKSHRPRGWQARAGRRARRAGERSGRVRLRGAGSEPARIAVHTAAEARPRRDREAHDQRTPR